MCYHEESLHRDNTSPPPALPAPIATSSLSPLLANRPNNPPGIPTNTAIPILRSFLADPLDAMHLSLKFIKEIDEVRALVLLPWMTIARGQDWRQLPNPRRTQLLQMITGLEIDVSLRFVDQRWKNKPEAGA